MKIKIFFQIYLNFQVEYYREGSPVTKDLRFNRVRVFYKPRLLNIIVQVPVQG